MKQAAIERGEEIPVKPGKKPVPAGAEGSKTQVECALNKLYNMEKRNRTGRCDYYQDFGHQARTVRVGTRKGCNVGMHPECDYNYHQVRYGVYLHKRYKINHSRRKQRSEKK